MILLQDNRIPSLSSFLNFVVADMVKCDFVYIAVFNRQSSDLAF
jgi:hypothetical protein